MIQYPMKLAQSLNVARARLLISSTQPEYSSKPLKHSHNLVTLFPFPQQNCNVTLTHLRRQKMLSCHAAILVELPSAQATAMEMVGLYSVQVQL